MVRCAVDSLAVVLVTAVPLESSGCEPSNITHHVIKNRTCKKYETGNKSCCIHQYYNKSDAKTIHLVLSVFVVSLYLVPDPVVWFSLLALCGTPRVRSG